MCGGFGRRALSTTTLVFCSFGLNFGVPLLLAARELMLVLTLPRGSGERGEDLPPAPLPLPAAGKSLPDCLIPKPMPARIRELA
jgi:hypothetical protein